MKIVTATAIVFFSLALAGGQTARRADDGNLTGKTGKDLFLQNTCYGCHGFSGQNGPGARLVPMKMTQVVFLAYVRNPPRANAMPSYSQKAVPDADLIAIYNYLKTLPDSDPQAKDVPVLSGILDEVSKPK